jgi:3-dehydroquinate dehydratase/shikimate dehydrogenase
MICVPIISETTERAIEDMNRAIPFADLIEIRADYIKNPDLKSILSAKKKPVIITIMPKHENGKFVGPEEERIALLKQAIDLGADYIDINLGCPGLEGLLKNRKGTKAIVSYHSFKDTPHDLPGICRALEAQGADIIKIATFANRLSDNLKMLNLIKESETDIIGICMGELGEISRVLAPLYGSYLTFASLEKGQESAPGQIPAETLKNIYRLEDIKPDFKIYGLIGNPVSKSKGYILFNSLFRRYGLNSVYLNFLVDDLKDFTDNFPGMLAGFSITMPHKQAIMRCLDEIDPLAEKIGAVNTVINRHGKLAGYNTDMIGVLIPIQEKKEIRGSRVTLLGAGGAARAIAVGIVENGGILTILNRTVAKAEKLAAELNCGSGPLSDFKDIRTDILINMTSVGMQPHVDETPVDTDLVRAMVVFDGIYNPPRTRLITEAEKNGCTVIPGTEMFINQAAEQFRLWTNIRPDTNLVRKIMNCPAASCGVSPR